MPSRAVAPPEAGRDPQKSAGKRQLKALNGQKTLKCLYLANGLDPVPLPLGLCAPVSFLDGAGGLRPSR